MTNEKVKSEYTLYTQSAVLWSYYSFTRITIFSIQITPFQTFLSVIHQIYVQLYVVYIWQLHG